jgi:hypothetical protein
MTHVSDQENYSKDSNQFKFHKLHFWWLLSLLDYESSNMWLPQ